MNTLMTREIVSAGLRDRAFFLGLLGGTLTSVAGVSGYIVVPFLTGEVKYLLNAAMNAGFGMPGFPLWYHGIVLFLPSFLASLVGTLLVRRWGLTGRTSVLKLIGGVVGVPIAVLLMAYLITAVGFGISASITLAEESPISAVFGVFVFTGLALAFGLIAVGFATAIVVPGISLGATCGYVLAYGLIRLDENLVSVG